MLYIDNLLSRCLVPTIYFCLVVETGKLPGGMYLYERYYETKHNQQTMITRTKNKGLSPKFVVMKQNKKEKQSVKQNCISKLAAI